VKGFEDCLEKDVGCVRLVEKESDGELAENAFDLAGTLSDGCAGRDNDGEVGAEPVEGFA
jgi:hypothetical protein